VSFSSAFLNTSHLFLVSSLSHSAPLVMDNQNYVVRIIFIYSRSDVIPSLATSAPASANGGGTTPSAMTPKSPSEAQEQIGKEQNIVNRFPPLRHPLFFFDCLYLHNPTPSAQSVFDTIVTLDDEGCSGYFEEQSVQPQKLARSMAFLLAHPCQRAPQPKQVTSL